MPLKAFDVALNLYALPILERVEGLMSAPFLLRLIPVSAKLAEGVNVILSAVKVVPARILSAVPEETEKICA